MLAKMWTSCWGEGEMVQPLRKIVWHFLKWLNRVTIGPSKKGKRVHTKAIVHEWSERLICNSPKVDTTPKSTTNGSMWYVHIVESYLDIKRNEALAPAATWVDLESVICMYTCMIWAPTLRCLAAYHLESKGPWRD